MTQCRKNTASQAHPLALFGLIATATLPFGSGLLPGDPAFAQITPDGTLGYEASRVNPNGAVRGLPAILIEGGARRGSSLFQSFSDFSVGEAQRVYFANPTGIQNILSRVTGVNPSNILGTLGVNGTANLFLLNPRGILFGPNARLDVAGSFAASTADSFLFEDGTQYSAAHPEAPPLLAVNLRPGLQWGTQFRGDISNAGNLAVSRGQTLTLAGNSVTHTGSLTAPGGTVQISGDRISLLDNARVDVSAVGGGGTILVGGDYQGQGTVPNAKQTLIGSNVQMNADAIANGNGGRVIVWADHATRFYGSISARGGDNFGNGGFVEVSGAENLAFNGRVNVGALSGTPGTVLLDPRDIFIVSETAANDAELLDRTISSGDSGDTDFRISNTALEGINGSVTLQASRNITFDAPVNAPGITELTAEAGDRITVNQPITTNDGNIQFTAYGAGIFINSNITTNGGKVELKANSGSIAVSNAIIDTSADQGGVITLEARDRVSLSNAGLLGRSSNDSSAVFNGIGIAASQGSVSIDRSTISATNRGTGFAGDVVITARDQVEITNSNQQDTGDARLLLGIYSQGNQGQVFLGASEYPGFDFSPETVRISNSFVSTSNGAVPSGSNADAGRIFVIADGAVSITDNSTLRSRAEVGVQGNAGGVGISAGSLLIKDSNLTTSTFATNSSATSFTDFGSAPSSLAGSQAGAVIFLVRNDITLDNGDVFNNLENGAQGQAGGILLLSNSLTLQNGAQIQTLVRGSATGIPAQGNAGTILIGVDETITVIGRNNDGFSSAIFSSVAEDGVGDSGSIIIGARSSDRSGARSVQVRDGARIDVNNLGTGAAGNILLSARGLWLDNRARITASSLIGDGGNIFLDVSGAVILGRTSIISTSRVTSDSSGSSQDRAGNIAIGTGTLLLDELGPDGTVTPRFTDRIFLVAGKTSRDNDIFAVGFDANGGRIRINTFNLQDIAQRSDTLFTNDITTQSFLGIDGDTVISVLDIFPSLRTDPLPERFVPPRISQGCDPRIRQEASRFTITGRGGLPVNPNEVLTPDTLAGVDSTPTSVMPESSGQTTAITPAQGWVRTKEGTLRLIADRTDPTVPLQTYPLQPSSASCVPL